MATIFTKIIQGEIPCYKIAEDKRFFAFLDINPLKEGHTLVVPKIETDYIFDLDSETLAGLFLFASKVASAIESVVDCKRIGIIVAGLEVPHAHIHLIPMDSMGDLSFSKTRVKLNPEEYMDLANRISEKVRI
jgi:histidine triad (HIT) family protein